MFSNVLSIDSLHPSLSCPILFVAQTRTVSFAANTTISIPTGPRTTGACLTRAYALINTTEMIILITGPVAASAQSTTAAVSGPVCALKSRSRKPFCAVSMVAHGARSSRWRRDKSLHETGPAVLLMLNVCRLVARYVGLSLCMFFFYSSNQFHSK